MTATDQPRIVRLVDADKAREILRRYVSRWARL